MKVFGFYYAEAGDMEKCKSILETVAQWKYKMHANPEATIGYLSLAECRQSLTAMKEFLTSKNASSEKIKSFLQLLKED